jgi:hypothetical protein
MTYFRDVGISLSEDTAANVGFITRLYRVSELDNGAVEAVAKMQRMALERRDMIEILGRLDPRLEILDLMEIDHVLTSTGREITEVVIIESLEISLSDGQYTLRTTGRRKNV